PGGASPGGARRTDRRREEGSPLRRPHTGAGGRAADDRRGEPADVRGRRGRRRQRAPGEWQDPEAGAERLGGPVGGPGPAGLAARLPGASPQGVRSRRGRPDRQRAGRHRPSALDAAGAGGGDPGRAARRLVRRPRPVIPMTSTRGPVRAVRVELYAPVASFRDPMFPGVSRCLPVPPPSTVRGMLAAATGRVSEPITLGLAASAEGRGVDAEPYHPIAADGSNPAVAGRVAAGKGGMTIRDRPFLIGVRLTIWIPAPEGDRIARALRRPVWGLRLGRSQDLVHVVSIREVTLYPAERAKVGHALAPVGGHQAPLATTLRLAEAISSDRGRTEYRSYQWCSEPAGEHAVVGAYRDEDQAVWLSSPAEVSEHDAELSQVLAKSASGSGLGRPELLTEHSLAVRDATRTIANRIGSPGVLASHPKFLSWVETAALLHDASKVAEGFQCQVRPSGERWGERHEVLSLAYVDLLTRHL